MSRITIFTGHYGSGKTETALNYAFDLKEQGEDVIIVDLDIVNPYYRTKDAEALLKEKGIELIASVFANSNVDVPALPPDIYKVFADKNKKIVFDVGGDDDGAIALGRYFNYFKDDDVSMYIIVNGLRPLTGSKEDIIIMVNDISANSRLKPAGLINNTNISFETKIEDVLNGEKLVYSAASELGIPVIYNAVEENLYKDFKSEFDIPKKSIKRYLSLPWQV